MWWDYPLALEPAAAAPAMLASASVPAPAPLPSYRLDPVTWGAAPIDLARARALLWHELQRLEQAEAAARAPASLGAIAPPARARPPARA